MIILIIGGAYQGKLAFALSLGSYSEKDVSEGGFDKPIINNLQDMIRKLLESGQDARAVVVDALKQDDKIAICNEIGCGIVPADKSEREYREATGRILCEIAQLADQVYRVQCGIAVKIKG